MRALAAFASGLLFGGGLALASMTDPNRVLAFLDVGGAWDPSLLFVLGSAVTVTAIAFRKVLRRDRPLLADRFLLPGATAVDGRLVTGTALFGVGWGLAGYCPGSAIATIGMSSWETWIFLPAMLLGMMVHTGASLLSAREHTPPHGTGSSELG